MSSPLGIYQHPRTLDLCKAVLADEHLAKLFPNASTENDATDVFAIGTNTQSMIYNNTGRGGSLQLLSLVGFMLSDAIFRVCIAEGELTWQGVSDRLGDTIKAIRTLSDGETANVPALIGLSGSRLADGLVIPIAGGQLRQPREQDTSLLLSGSQYVTAVFETTYPLRLLKIEEWNPQPDELPGQGWTKLEPRIEEAQRSFQRNLDMARLALLLASTKDEPFLANEVSRFVLDPTSAGGITSWNGSSWPIASFEIKSENKDAILEWHQLILHKHVHSLDVGMRRLLAATTTRIDANDAFVDAVVCWENVFGTTTETVFRVTGALAKLLEPNDLPKRQELQRELKKLYEKRSALVHGGKEPSAKEAWGIRERAIELAADCLRLLYRDRPDLLPHSSADRSAQLLME